MSYAHVVPLTHVAPGAPLFTYDIPSPNVVSIGSVVLVPWRQTTVEAVVWDVSLEAQTTASSIRSILGIVQEQPAITFWQRWFIDQVVAAYGFSRSTLLLAARPRAWIPLSRPESAVRPSSGPAEVWWDRHRSQTIERMSAWALQDGWRCILVPNRQTAKDLSAHFPGALVHASSPQTAAFARLYERVAATSSGCVIGTWSSLILPFPTPPGILCDDETQPAFHERDRAPYFSVPRLLDRLRIPSVRTTSAPRLDTYMRWRPAVPSSSVRRSLGSLSSARDRRWLSVELETLMAEKPWKKISLFAPRSGFASVMECERCGHQVSCQSCGQSLRLARADARHTRCRACGTIQTMPDSCPSCHGVAWRYRGYGLEAFQGLLQALQGEYPTISLTLSTYKDLPRWRPHGDQELVVFLLGEALRTWPDFSADERAWQLLAQTEARLLADSAIHVQCIHPDDTFWQRWRFSYDQEWYESELLQRQKYAMPPAVEQWLLVRPGRDVSQAEQELQSIFRPCIDLVQWKRIDRPGRAANAARQLFVLQPRGDGLLADVCRQIFPLPRPWEVDMDVDSWVA